MSALMFTRDGKRVPTWNPFVCCGFDCIYCWSKLWYKEKAKCLKCRRFEPHLHEDRLRNPKLQPNKWYFGCATGDVYWADWDVFADIINVIRNSPETTVMLQSKEPSTFARLNNYPDNLVLGTTLETNRNKPDLVHSYKRFSQAPLPETRVLALEQIEHSRKYVALEPLFFFDTDGIIRMLERIKPEIIYYGIGNHEDELGITLPTPNPDQVRELGKALEQNFPEATVIPKTIETPGKYRPDEEDYALLEGVLEWIKEEEG